jgi:hypothetical protein
MHVCGCYPLLARIPSLFYPLLRCEVLVVTQLVWPTYYSLLEGFETADV